MSAIALRRPHDALSEGLVSRGLAADGDRRRAACACARAERAFVARSGCCVGGRRARLRQRRHRPFSPCQPASAGLSERTLPDLHARLEEIDLIDADPEVERLRNIVASPLDDLDPEALLDLGPSVAALETRLNGGREPAPSCRRSSASSSTRRGASRLATSMRTSALKRRAMARSRCISRATMRWLRNARRPRRAMSRRGLALRFSPLRALANRRRAGCGRWSSGSERPAVFAEARLRDEAVRAFATTRLRCATSSARTTYGAAVVVGAAAPFGEIEAVRFKALIERACALGASSLRLTPWRAFLIVGLDPRSADLLVHSMAELGFIVDADDPRLRIAACPGAPACMHGHRSVRDDATRWAA